MNHFLKIPGLLLWQAGDSLRHPGRKPCAQNMDESDLAEPVSGQRSVVCIHTVCGYQNVVQFWNLPYRHDDRCMGEAVLLKAQLHKISRLEHIQGGFQTEGSLSPF